MTPARHGVHRNAHMYRVPLEHLEHPRELADPGRVEHHGLVLGERGDQALRAVRPRQWFAAGHHADHRRGRRRDADDLAQPPVVARGVLAVPVPDHEVVGVAVRAAQRTVRGREAVDHQRSRAHRQPVERADQRPPVDRARTVVQLLEPAEPFEVVGVRRLSCAQQQVGMRPVEGEEVVAPRYVDDGAEGLASHTYAGHQPSSNSAGSMAAILHAAITARNRPGRFSGDRRVNSRQL